MVRTFQDMVKQLEKRASTKTASTVPETDPADKGGVAIPKDPDGASTKTVGLTNTTNADTTKVLPTPTATTVDGPEKAAAAMAAKAATIVAGIRQLSATLNKKAAEQGDAIAKTENTEGGAGGQKAKTVPLPAGDAKGEIPASKTNTDETKKEKGVEAKEASGEDFNLDPSFHLKLASLILATEDGRKYAQNVIEKAHGAEAAADIVKAAMVMENMANQASAEEVAGVAAADETWNALPDEEKENIVKLAAYHEAIRSGYGTDVEQEAYTKGAMQAAAMQDAGVLGGPEGAAGPEAPGGTAEGAAAAAPGGEPGGAPGGDEAPDLETIVQALDEMVTSGELQPDVAAEILQMLTNGEDGGGSAAPAAGPEGSPADGPGPDGSAKHEAVEAPKQEKAEQAAGDKDEKSAAIKKAYDLAASYVATLK